MQPRQIRDTSRPVEPSFTYCIVAAPVFGRGCQWGAYVVTSRAPLLSLPLLTAGATRRFHPSDVSPRGAGHTEGRPAGNGRAPSPAKVARTDGHPVRGGVVPAIAGADMPVKGVSLVGGLGTAVGAGLLLITAVTACGAGSDEQASGTTTATTRPKPAPPTALRLPPRHADFDYQIGG